MKICLFIYSGPQHEETDTLPTTLLQNCKNVKSSPTITDFSFMISENIVKLVDCKFWKRANISKKYSFKFKVLRNVFLSVFECVDFCVGGCNHLDIQQIDTVIIKKQKHLFELILKEECVSIYCAFLLNISINMFAIFSLLF